MAKPGPDPTEMADSDFDVLQPTRGSTYPLPQGTILVVVRNNQSLDNGFTATLNELVGGSLGSTVDSGRLTLSGGSGVIYTGLLNAGVLPGSVPAANNKRVTVQGFVGAMAHGSPDPEDFKAWTGSGAFGLNVSASSGAAATGAGPGKPPLPTMVQVQPEATDADQPSAALTLVHSQDPAFAGCWFSEPIDLRLGHTTPGFWMLRRSGTAWTLFLWCGGAVVVMYHQAASDAAAPAFPAQLGLADRGTAGWPRTVTVSPAP